MDKSETYRKMCDCFEIFKQCKFRKGDWFGDVREPWMILEDCDSRPQHENRDHFSGLSWLPRQDQIQEMCHEWKTYTPETRHLLNDFIDWLNNVGTLTYESLEQIWLRFFMNEFHKKTWNGDEWINSEQIVEKQPNHLALFSQ